MECPTPMIDDRGKPWRCSRARIMSTWRCTSSAVVSFAWFPGCTTRGVFASSITTFGATDSSRSVPWYRRSKFTMSVGTAWISDDRCTRRITGSQTCLQKPAPCANRSVACLVVALMAARRSVVEWREEGMADEDAGSGARRESSRANAEVRPRRNDEELERSARSTSRARKGGSSIDQSTGRSIRT